MKRYKDAISYLSSRNYKSVILKLGIMIVFLRFLSLLSPAVADAIAATATLNLHTMTKETSLQVTVRVTNTGTNGIKYIKITRPTSAVSLAGQSSAWGCSGTAEYYICTGRTLNSGSTDSFFIDLESGSSEGSGNFTIEVSDQSSGTGAAPATGDLSFSVSGSPPDTTAPTIANVSTTSTSSSITVNWSTNESASTVVYYGTTSSYGGTSQTSEYVLSHSQLISDLDANTVYYFQIYTADESGNSSTYESYTVTLPVGSATPTPTSTPAPTSASATSTPTPSPTTVPSGTPTPTPVIDTTSPQVQIHSLNKDTFRKPPAFSVLASDDSGISQVAYSVNSSSYKVISGISSTGSREISFSFTPGYSEKTGAYSLNVKVTDLDGNITVSIPVTYSIDADPPVISLNTEFEKIVSLAPPVEGSARDASGISKIEFSYDGGKLWQPLMMLETSTGAEFEASVPDPAREGSYTILLRATDPVGNVNTIGPYSFIVDRLAPRAGSVLVRVNNMLLSPPVRNTIKTMAGFENRIIISTTGGVSGGSIIFHSADTDKEERLKLNASTIAGFWEALYTPNLPGMTEIWTILDDKVHTPEKEFLFTMDTLPRPCITDKNTGYNIPATINVRTYDEWQNRFVSWRSLSYNEQNPLSADSGCFGIILPADTYEVEIASPGYRMLRTGNFTLNHAEFFSSGAGMEKNTCIGIGIFRLCIPVSDQIDLDLSDKLSGFTYKTGTVDMTGIIKRGTPYDAISGRESVLVLLNSWMPQVTGIIDEIEKISPQLNKSVYVVFPLETDTSVEIWRRQAGYKIPIIADPDGLIFSVITDHVLPLSVDVNDKGIITGMSNDINKIGRQVQ